MCVKMIATSTELKLDYSENSNVVYPKTYDGANKELAFKKAHSYDSEEALLMNGVWESSGE